MGNEFQRLKRQNSTWVLIRALGFGLAGFMLSAGILLLGQKMRLLQAGAAGYILCLLIAVAVAVAAYCLLRKSDLQLAEKIDKERMLRERVQTMVAYQNDDGAVAQLQRQDTENRLKQVRSMLTNAGSLAAQMAVLVISFVVFMVGIMLPAEAVQAGPTTQTQPTEPFYEATDWQKAALEELIEHVNASQMEGAVKTPVTESLTQLRQLLDTPVRVSQVQAKVVENMVQAYALADEANSHDDMHKVLSMMGQKVGAYLSYCMGNLALEDYDEKMAMAEVLLKQDNYANIGKIAAEVMVVLTHSEYDSKDPLYAAVEKFGQELTAAAQALENKNLVDARQMTGEAIYNLRSDAALALEQQWLNKEEAVYVVNTLAEIFSISGSLIPKDPDRTYELDNSEPPPELEGAQGSGQMQYPSDDKVYDYENNLHVIYHEILDAYYKAMTNDAMDGKFSEEIEKFLREYFASLQTNKDDEE